MFRHYLKRASILLLGCSAWFPLYIDARTVVANYRDDFQPGNPRTAGWEYLWNAPPGWAIGSTGDQTGGFIGVPDGYLTLISNGTGWTPDGDTVGSNNLPSGFLALSATGGHPGPSAGGTNKRDRYAIAAYTVPSSGYYTIENSFITVPNSGSDGIEVLVFPGRSEAISKVLGQAVTTPSFDTEIGYLDSGQTIYVAFGPKDASAFNTFQMDFSIVRYERQSFRDQLLNGMASGAEVITIQPGRYYVNPSSAYLYKANFNPSNPVTIVAEGVELINQSSNRTLSFVNCSNFTLRGLTIDYDPHLYRQGTVETRNYATKTFQLRLHEGYPQTLAANATSGITYEPSNLLMKQMTGTVYPNGNISEIEPGLFSIQASFSNMNAGDYVSLTVAGGIPHTIYLESCTQLHLEDVTIHGAPAFAVLSRNGHQIDLQNVQVVPGKTPLRASVPRLLSSNADGLHFKHSYGEITINNCHTAYTGDDGIILTTAYSPILEKNATNVITVATKSPQETIAPGDAIYIYAPKAGIRENAVIQTVTPVALSETEIRSQVAASFPNANLTNSTFEQAFLLTLDSNVATGRGGIVANRSGDSSHSVISNCSINNTRARGILIKASNVLVQKNEVFNSFLPGIQVRPDADYWMEGDFSHNILIENNNLIRCSLARYNGYAPIYVSANGFDNWKPGIGHSNLTIRRNKISTPASASILVEYADNVEIRSNHTTNSHNFINAAPFYDAVIRLQRVNNVNLHGVNLVSGINQSNANLSALIETGADVTGLTVVDGLLLDHDSDQMPDEWELTTFGSTSVVDANDDSDGDGILDRIEFIGLLNPLERDSLHVSIVASDSIQLQWVPKPNRFITVYRSENLNAPFAIVEEHIPAEIGVYTLPTEDDSSLFYRIAITD